MKSCHSSYWFLINPDRRSIANNAGRSSLTDQQAIKPPICQKHGQIAVRFGAILVRAPQH